MEADPAVSHAAAHLLRPLVLALEARGIAPAALFAGTGFGPDVLAGTRVPESAVRALWQRAVALTGEASLGLRIGRSTEPQALGLLGLVLSNARDIGQAFALLNRFHRLVYDAVPFRLETAADGHHVLHLHRDPQAQAEEARPFVEFLLAAVLRLAGALAGPQAQGAPYLQALHFRHRQPDELDSYHETFPGAVLRFGQADNAVHFDAALFARPVAYADDAMLALLKQRADRELRELAVETDLVSRARAAIRRRLAGAAPTVTQVAADCHMSRASLQRHLAAAGSGFRQLLDQERFAAARELLRDPAHSGEHIAMMLGYADVSAFHHAFRRWSGTTPASFRGRRLR